MTEQARILINEIPTVATFARYAHDCASAAFDNVDFYGGVILLHVAEHHNSVIRVCGDLRGGGSTILFGTIEEAEYYDSILRRYSVKMSNYAKIPESPLSSASITEPVTIYAHPCETMPKNTGEQSALFRWCLDKADGWVAWRDGVIYFSNSDDATLFFLENTELLNSVK